MKVVAFLEVTSLSTIQERTKVPARYEVRNVFVVVQKQRSACKGKQETLRAEIITSSHTKLMTTGSVNRTSLNT